jgi:hypothetical protein
VQDDDVNGIPEKILAADVLVPASPVYFRVCPIYPMMHGREVYFIVSAAGGAARPDQKVVARIREEGDRPARPPIISCGWRLQQPDGLGFRPGRKDVACSL